MERRIKDYLFGKHILVCEHETGDLQSATALLLANNCGIKIVSGEEYLHSDMVPYSCEMIGTRVPDPFYTGFPESVLKLSRDELLADQIIHYMNTYGYGNWGTTGHSVFEETIERKIFNERTDVKEFSVMDEASAVEYARSCVDDLLSGTRPMNIEQMGFVVCYIESCGYKPEHIASKSTAITLLVWTLDAHYYRFVSIQDIPRIVETIISVKYPGMTIKKLNLKNKDRKLIDSLIRYTLNSVSNLDDVCRECDEKRSTWKGLLHHIHFAPKTWQERDFSEHIMGSGPNTSAYAKADYWLKNGYAKHASECIKKYKGSGAVARNLDYILSYCNDEDSARSVITDMDGVNGIILMQLLNKYESVGSSGPRVFKFTKNGKMKVHYETDEECSRRKTGLITDEIKKHVDDAINDMLVNRYKNKLGRVYIDPGMKNVALPMQESTGVTGFGVLPRGSKIQIPEGKKIRAFTYWEKVGDIDLSAFGITESGEMVEFSWRTMFDKQSGSIVYSGDETSGYNGGSEYFDINVEKFKKEYPDVRRIIFCNNVYSCVSFSSCFCKAGFMLRDVNDSGQVFEPKTVETSFMITQDSMFAYLFGIDVETNEFVWLNMSRDGAHTIAGNTSMDWIVSYFDTTRTMNYHKFFSMLATEIVDDPSVADIIVSDNTFDLAGIAEKQIHSYDIERVIGLMNS